MTETSRRALLRAGALAAAAAPLAAPGLAATANAASTARTARGLYARSRFAPLVGRTFTMEEPGRRWRMRLTFAASGPGPDQGTFVVRRTGFAATTLFLVPIGTDGRTYEAVVNNR
jgi:hypothetical protein